MTRLDRILLSIACKGVMHTICMAGELISDKLLQAWYEQTGLTEQERTLDKL